MTVNLKWKCKSNTTVPITSGAIAVKRGCCPHEAAFWYYVEEHPELFKTPQNDIDEDYYYDELDRITDLGKGHDYQYHEILDFDRMAGSLSRFITEDIENLLNDGGYELACELLCSVSDLLSDEYAVDSDMWYDVAEEFCQCKSINRVNTY